MVVDISLPWHVSDYGEQPTTAYRIKFAMLLQVIVYEVAWVANPGFPAWKTRMVTTTSDVLVHHANHSLKKYCILSLSKASNSQIVTWIMKQVPCHWILLIPDPLPRKLHHYQTAMKQHKDSFNWQNKQCASCKTMPTKN